MPLLIAGRIRFAKMARAGAIASGEPADLPVLLGIASAKKEEKNKEIQKKEIPDEEDILDISGSTPSVSKILSTNEESDEESDEEIEENADDGDKEE
jgi:hypothetical protein